MVISSTFSQMEVIVLTVSTGYEPIVVSSLVIMASHPAITAPATSVTSAFVGLILVFIEYIIWVATITPLP